MTERRRLLSLFCRFHGLDIELLDGDDRYAIAGAPPDFDGQVSAIRLTEHGRFGNVVFQLLHAVLLARQLGCTTIEMFPFRGGPPPGRHEAGGLVFDCAEHHAGQLRTLVGHFFNSYAFQSALCGFAPEQARDAVERVLRPLFGELLAFLPDTADDAVTMNFRGGDVFAEGAVPAWYVQPPASYYVRAALYACAELGAARVVMVAEDDTNPALAIASAALRRHGVPVVVQSGRFEDDLAVLLAARHLVSPFGTLCEAVALLSPRLASYCAFRQFESHRHLHARPALLTRLLQAGGVRLVRIHDGARDYIPALAWQRSDAQLDLLRTYPAEALVVHDLACQPDGVDDRWQPMAPGGASEAHALRLALIAAHRRLAAEREAAAVAAQEHAAQRRRDQAAQVLQAAEAAGALAACEARAAAEAREAASALLSARAGQEAAQEDARTARLAHAQAQAEADALRASTSWRLTAPLRLAAARLRGTP